MSKPVLTKLRFIALTAILFTTIVPPVLAASDSTNTPPEFVRTANYFLLSGSKLDDPKTINTLSKFDLLVLPAEAQVFNAATLMELHKRNPDIIILAYVPTVSFNNLYWSDTLHNHLKKGIQSDWWLQDGNGNQKTIWPNTSALNLNSGWTPYLANFVKTNILSTGLWDGVFYDEVTDHIAWAGSVDTNRDGRADTSAEADKNWQNGYLTLFSKTRTLVGSSTVIITNGSSNPLYQSQVNGRMFESFPTPWEGDGSWTTVMKNYLNLQTQVGKNPIFILNRDTNNTGNNTDYRSVRYGITSTLLGDGYFGFDFGTQNHGQLWSYDEYDVELGSPKGDPKNLLLKTSTAGGGITNGLWSRDFEEGKIVVNTSGTTQTVHLDGEYEKIHGKQDPKTNNGAITSRLTVAANDGIILLRPIDHIDNAVFLNGSFARIFDNAGKNKRTGFFAYDSTYKGGQRIINIDLDGDKKKETIVANDTYVDIYKNDGSLYKRFEPYGPTFRQGITLAIGDLTGDGKQEIVTGTKNGGGPQVRVFDKDAKLLNPGFFAFDEKFRGGVNVAIGDINGDNENEIIVGAGVGGGPQIRVFNRDGKLLNPGFFAYDEKFRGGVNVAAGDTDGDRIDEIIAGAGMGGGPQIRVFDKNGKVKYQFFGLDEDSRTGVDVTATDLDNNGRDEIISLSNDVFTFSAF